MGCPPCRSSSGNARMLRTAHEQVRRGRSQAAFALVERNWTTWRGRAVEPLIRESLELAALSGCLPWPGSASVGGWWNRQFNPEIDLVGADRGPVARRVLFAGSVKWLGSRFDRHDLAELMSAAAQVPGFVPGHSGLAVVSLSGVASGLDKGTVGLVWGPDDVIAAWQDTDATPPGP